jgi:beta-glucosidase
MGELFLFILLASVSAQVLPADFAWGSATAAFQVEGAWNVSGRTESIWDTFQDNPGRIYNNETAHVADDFYNRYQSDIDLMVSLGIKAFRMSFSWTRLLPNGDLSVINQEGVDFYMSLLTSLKSSGIEPYVTLYHWDLPSSFNSKSNTSGWLDPDMPNKFNTYSDFCFQTFGHLVKNWLTMNEIQTFAWVAYGLGIHAPGRCSSNYGSWCEEVGGGGNSSTEPYIVAHHALIAHALAVRTLRTKYKSQNGRIGLTINSGFELPFNTSDLNDVNAVNTAVAFEFGWFADPVVFGRYPPEMTQAIQDGRLPSFNQSMAKLLAGSFDFLGLNYYGSYYVKWTGQNGNDYASDGKFYKTGVNATGHQIGPQADSSWLYVYPQGIRLMLNWIKKRYNSPEIYVFENGVSCPNESEIPFPAVLNDTFRVDYVYHHVMTIMDSIIIDKVNVKGYFLWSLLDNFEWTDGYRVRFGITYIDYSQNLTRHLKESAYLYASLINYLGTSNPTRTPSLKSLVSQGKLLIN